MPGSPAGRSSPRTFPRGRWQGSRRGRRRRKAGSTRMESATREVARLPGLEAVGDRVETKPGHWLERGAQKRLVVFSGRSPPELAGRIVAESARLAGTDIELGEIE